ncbi:hypothetical protein AWENTII_006191 [Aspergillus wentii]
MNEDPVQVPTENAEATGESTALSPEGSSQTLAEGEVEKKELPEPDGEIQYPAAEPTATDQEAPETTDNNKSPDDLDAATSEPIASEGPVAVETSEMTPAADTPAVDNCSTEKDIAEPLSVDDSNPESVTEKPKEPVDEDGQVRALPAETEIVTAETLETPDNTAPTESASQDPETPADDVEPEPSSTSKSSKKNKKKNKRKSGAATAVEQEPAETPQASLNEDTPETEPAHPGTEEPETKQPDDVNQQTEQIFQETEPNNEATPESVVNHTAESPVADAPSGVGDAADNAGTELRETSGEVPTNDEQVPPETQINEETTTDKNGEPALGRIENESNLPVEKSETNDESPHVPEANVEPETETEPGTTPTGKKSKKNKKKKQSVSTIDDAGTEAPPSTDLADANADIPVAVEEPSTSIGQEPGKEEIVEKEMPQEIDTETPDTREMAEADAPMTPAQKKKAKKDKKKKRQSEAQDEVLASGPTAEPTPGHGQGDVLPEAAPDHTEKTSALPESETLETTGVDEPERVDALPEQEQSNSDTSTATEPPAGNEESKAPEANSITEEHKDATTGADNAPNEEPIIIEAKDVSEGTNDAGNSGIETTATSEEPTLAHVEPAQEDTSAPAETPTPTPGEEVSVDKPQDDAATSLETTPDQSQGNATVAENLPETEGGDANMEATESASQDQTQAEPQEQAQDATPANASKSKKDKKKKKKRQSQVIEDEQSTAANEENAKAPSDPTSDAAPALEDPPAASDVPEKSEDATPEEPLAEAVPAEAIPAEAPSDTTQETTAAEEASSDLKEEPQTATSKKKAKKDKKKRQSQSLGQEEAAIANEETEHVPNQTLDPGSAQDFPDVPSTSEKEENAVPEDALAEAPPEAAQEAEPAEVPVSEPAGEETTSSKKKAKKDKKKRKSVSFDVEEHSVESGEVNEPSENQELTQQADEPKPTDENVSSSLGEEPQPTKSKKKKGKKGQDSVDITGEVSLAAGEEQGSAKTPSSEGHRDTQPSTESIETAADTPPDAESIQTEDQPSPQQDNMEQISISQPGAEDGLDTARYSEEAMEAKQSQPDADVLLPTKDSDQTAATATDEAAVSDQPPPAESEPQTPVDEPEQEGGSKKDKKKKKKKKRNTIEANEDAPAPTNDDAPPETEKSPEPETPEVKEPEETAQPENAGGEGDAPMSAKAKKKAKKDKKRQLKNSDTPSAEDMPSTEAKSLELSLETANAPAEDDGKENQSRDTEQYAENEKDLVWTDEMVSSQVEQQQASPSYAYPPPQPTLEHTTAESPLVPSDDAVDSAQRGSTVATEQLPSTINKSEATDEVGKAPGDGPFGEPSVKEIQENNRAPIGDTSSTTEQVDPIIEKHPENTVKQNEAAGEPPVADIDFAPENSELEVPFVSDGEDFGSSEPSKKKKNKNKNKQNKQTHGQIPIGETEPVRPSADNTENTPCEQPSAVPEAKSTTAQESISEEPSSETNPETQNAEVPATLPPIYSKDEPFAKSSSEPEQEPPLAELETLLNTGNAAAPAFLGDAYEETTMPEADKDPILPADGTVTDLQGPTDRQARDAAEEIEDARTSGFDSAKDLPSVPDPFISTEASTVDHTTDGTVHVDGGSGNTIETQKPIPEVAQVSEESPEWPVEENKPLQEGETEEFETEKHSKPEDVGKQIATNPKGNDPSRLQEVDKKGDIEVTDQTPMPSPETQPTTFEPGIPEFDETGIPEGLIRRGLRSSTEKEGPEKGLPTAPQKQSKVASIFPELKRGAFRKPASRESVKDRAEEETMDQGANRDSAIHVLEAPIATDKSMDSEDIPNPSLARTTAIPTPLQDPFTEQSTTTETRTPVTPTDLAVDVEFDPSYRVSVLSDGPTKTRSIDIQWREDYGQDGEVKKNAKARPEAQKELPTHNDMSLYGPPPAHAAPAGHSSSASPQVDVDTQQQQQQVGNPSRELLRSPSIHGRHDHPSRTWSWDQGPISATRTPSPPRTFPGGPQLDPSTISPPRTPLDTISEQEPDAGVEKSGTKGTMARGRDGTPRLEMKPEHVLPRPETPVRKFTDNALARQAWPTTDRDDEIKRKTHRSSGRPADPGWPAEILRTPEQGMPILRPSSVSSIHSVQSTQSISSVNRALRRTTRNASGDLRAASRAQETSHPRNPQPPLSPLPSDLNVERIPSSSSYDPVTDKGKRPIRGMTDVYEGWGETPNSPRSPSRPPSVRRRQSMQQLQELETRLDRLISENRLLVAEREAAEKELRTTSVARRKSDHALNSRDADLRDREAEVEQLKNSVEWLQKEVTRLTKDNEGLTTTNTNLAATHANEIQVAREESTRELDGLRLQYQQLSNSLQDTVRQQIDAALAQKNAELRRLREDLEAARDKVKELQHQIAASMQDDILIFRDEDYFDAACQKLCGHVQQWVLRFSKHSDHRRCRKLGDLHDEKVADRFDNALLDGSDADTYLADRVRRRDVFMSVVMTMVWEFVFTRYLFGMDREQRQKLKSLEKHLGEVGPRSAVHRWRATTLTLLSKRPAFSRQRESDTEAVALEIFSTLSRLLPPPTQVEAQLLESLRKVLRVAVNLSVEMRAQVAEYIMLPPLQPEYDTNGDLSRQVYFNASLMNERSGETTSNDELETQQAVVRVVLFPLVVKKGNDTGAGDDEIVVCPAQVLVARPKDKKVVHMLSGDRMSIDGGRSVHSNAPSSNMDLSNVI